MLLRLSPIPSWVSKVTLSQIHLFLNEIFSGYQLWSRAESYSVYYCRMDHFNRIYSDDYSKRFCWQLLAKVNYNISFFGNSLTALRSLTDDSAIETNVAFKRVMMIFSIVCSAVVMKLLYKYFSIAKNTPSSGSAIGK
jgi:hypothetical protein